MKKSCFITMMMSVIGVIFLGIGMCMTMLPEWNMFNEGTIVGVIGLIILLITVLIYRKMEKKAPIHLNVRTIISVTLMIICLLGLGTRMSLSLVFNQLILGIPIGIVSILVLLCLIPLYKGLQ